MLRTVKEKFVVLKDITNNYIFINETGSGLLTHIDYIVLSEEVELEIPYFPEEEVVRLSLAKLLEQEKLVNLAAQEKLNRIAEQRTKLLSLTHQIEETL